MNYLKCDPSKIRTMNNYCIVEYLDDDVTKLSQKIVIIKQNNSTKLRSIYVGRMIQHPDFMYGNADKTVEFSLESIKDNETIVAYNPMSINTEVEWEDKKYHLIRVEDIHCVLEDWVKSEVVK